MRRQSIFGAGMRKERHRRSQEIQSTHSSEDEFRVDGLFVQLLAEEEGFGHIMTVSIPLETNGVINLYHAGIAAFVEKPMDPEVCAAQADALIRLYLQTEEKSRNRATLALGSSLVISPYHRQVMIEGAAISLTRKEFDLLHYLEAVPIG